MDSHSRPRVPALRTHLATASLSFTWGPPPTVHLQQNISAFSEVTRWVTVCVSFNQAELAVSEAESEGQGRRAARSMSPGADPGPGSILWWCQESGGLELGAFALITSYYTIDCSQACPTPHREQLWLLSPVSFFFKAALLPPSVLWVSHSVVSNSLPPPWTVAHQALLSMDFPGKNTGVGCHCLLQGIFPTQGSNPSLLFLLHCRRILHCWAIRKAPVLLPISTAFQNSCCSQISCPCFGGLGIFPRCPTF